MKKEFAAPVIAVCAFSAEDIITESGAMTASEIVEGELNANTTIVADWNSMKE